MSRLNLTQLTSARITPNLKFGSLDPNYNPNQGRVIIVAAYMNDIILIVNDVVGRNELKRYLDDIFSIKDLGHLSFFLALR